MYDLLNRYNIAYKMYNKNTTGLSKPIYYEEIDKNISHEITDSFKYLNGSV
jgi:hypothetical protein